MDMREAGVLMPIASLPSKYGIGAFSKSAYDFVDWLVEAGQSYWQVLPLGPTGYGDSPYQSFSTFAGNPYFIDLEELIHLGYLTYDQCEGYDFGDNPRYIDYEKIYNARYQVLKTAYYQSRILDDEDFRLFVHKQKEWLQDYALYMVIKDLNDGKAWNQWERPLKERHPEAIASIREHYSEEIGFYEFQQYLFHQQWLKLKNYANEKGVKIIGDIPIYVAFDSSDAWASPELFEFSENLMPYCVAGCPPDSFSSTGQLWGNPLYDWKEHKRTHYAWWLKRLNHCFKWYDMVRIDHFRGFDEFYSIPNGDQTAENGSWKKGPGYDIFKQINESLVNAKVIAEDLGYLTETVVELLRQTGYPGMKVLQFAFDSREASDYLPHNYTQNCVVYTGTHDNDTVKGWYRAICPEDKALCNDYLNIQPEDEENIHWHMIRAALSSVAKLAVIPIQDYLGLGSEARINTPSTLGNNWHWRLYSNELDSNLAQRVEHMTKLYGR
jgi:4-alpha-glucanotransferase